MPKPPAKSSFPTSDRQDRLARALRANLKRRKAQDRERGRAKADAQAPGSADDEEPGVPDEGVAPRPRPNPAQKGP